MTKNLLVSAILLLMAGFSYGQEEPPVEIIDTNVYVDFEHPTYPVDSFQFIDSGYLELRDTFPTYEHTIPTK